MKATTLLVAAAAMLSSAALPAQAGERYRQRPPVVVSPDLSNSWIFQLGKPQKRVARRQISQDREPGSVQVQPSRRVNRSTKTGIFALLMPDPEPRYQEAPRERRAALQAAFPAPTRKEIRAEIDPVYLPQQVDYDGQGKPGDIVIDSADKFLYLVLANGKARRYGVGVGKEGFGWTGTETVTEKKVWPQWRPPAEMIAREREKGRILPALMEGGPANPLGARALYLGDTLYRIHGTNAPWTIGTNVSSGCIRLRNEDVSDLFDRVDVGTRVIVM